MKILSLGAGVQSTALALMSCENAARKTPQYPSVPVYDLVIFCDLGFEPPWIKEQVEFTRAACHRAGIAFEVLDSPLYRDFSANFGERRTISIPWWTLGADGHKSRMPRNCTVDYKAETISRFVRWEVLGYRKGQRLKDWDKKAHEMHLGFSAEERRRCKASPNPLFHNRFPLAEMGLTRVDNYAYLRETWGMVAKASACAFCPFHTNYFYGYLRENHPEEYRRVVSLDRLLADKNPKPPMDSDLYISKSRKRIEDLGWEDCQDGEFFQYQGQAVWNGF